MSFIAPHQLTDGVLHCPRVGQGYRVKPLASDSFRYDCPACGAKLVIRERPVVTVLREIVEVPSAEARLA